MIAFLARETDVLLLVQSQVAFKQELLVTLLAAKRGFDTVGAEISSTSRSSFSYKKGLISFGAESYRKLTYRISVCAS